jgi:hypothetical protein
MTPGAVLPGARWNFTMAVLPFASRRVCWFSTFVATACLTADAVSLGGGGAGTRGAGIALGPRTAPAGA